MANLTPRYSAEERRRLTELIYPEEHWAQFGDRPWHGEGFRHYLDPKVVCIEHYMPKGREISPNADRELKTVGTDR
jgi:hypothetical protein